MKMIIEISESDYNECKMQVEMMRQEGVLFPENLNTTLKFCIADGTPLTE